MMSDFDRTKEQKNKKFFGFHKEKRDHGVWGTRRMPIILAKPNRDRDREVDGDKERTESRSPAKPLSQPTMILKNREGENRPVPQLSSQRPPSVLRKESDAQPLYQLASKHSNVESVNPLAPPPLMRGPVKLLEEGVQPLSDAVLEYLLEQTDFLVVGVLGTQGVGKSTVASLLAGSEAITCLTDPAFPLQGREQHEQGSHCTAGIDVMVTTNRIIILDTQPLLSPSLMDRLALPDSSKKYMGSGPMGPPGPPGVPDFSSPETLVEVQSLQQAAFVLSVCHIVILVQDWFFDANIIRFLQTAEMLKPSTPTTSPDDEIIEYFPHLLLLQNKATSSDFGPRAVRLMQEVYNRLFVRSRLQIQTGMGIATGDVIEYLQAETCGEAFNLYLLPDLSYELQSLGRSGPGADQRQGHSDYFSGHPGIEPLVSSLRAQLMGSSVQPLSHSPLTEKNWFHYSSKIWEAIKKSSFFLEYSRLLP